MKMLMICCAGSRIDDLRKLLEGQGVQGYTEIPALRGSGATGKHMGTRAWPGACSMVITAVEDAAADTLVRTLESFQATCRADEGVRVMVLPVERMV